MEETVSKRRGRAFIALLVLVFLVLIAVGLVSALKLGVAVGMASVAVGFLGYQIPATGVATRL